MDFRKNFSQRFEYLRKQKGVSLAALGEYLGVTDEAVRLLEKGKRSPSFEVLCALAAYFDITIDYLIGRSNDDTPVSFHSNWEDIFREKLNELLPSFDRTDLYDAYIDVSYLESIANGEAPLTLHHACDIADELGVSLDFLMGRIDDPDINK